MRLARQTERSGWRPLSADPVIDWLLEEAVMARLDHERGKTAEHQAAHDYAHQQAQAMLQKAAG